MGGTPIPTSPDPIGPARGHTLVVFTVVALAVGWTALSVPLVTGLPSEPFVLAATAFGLVVPALVLARRERSGAVRELFRDLVRLPRPALVLVPAALAIPLGTFGVAALAGFAVVPDGSEAVGIAVQTVTGLLLVNLLEELVWMGFVQRRLAVNRGPVTAALVTASLFAALHLPLGVAGWRDGPAAIAAGIGALLVAGVGLRLLIGAIDTLGGSLLAAAVAHASFNAAGAFVEPGGDAVRYAVTGVAGVLAMAAVVRGRSEPGRARPEPAEPGRTRRRTDLSHG